MNLERGGTKGKKVFLDKSYVIMEYNMSIRMSLTKNKSWEAILVYLKVEG